jgi:hypothetical protein
VKPTRKRKKDIRGRVMARVRGRRHLGLCLLQLLVCHVEVSHIGVVVLLVVDLHDGSLTAAGDV